MAIETTSMYCIAPMLPLLPVMLPERVLQQTEHRGSPDLRSQIGRGSANLRNVDEHIERGVDT